MTVFIRFSAKLGLPSMIALFASVLGVGIQARECPATATGFAVKLCENELLTESLRKQEALAKAGKMRLNR